MTGYLRTPALAEHHLAFVCEDALWIADRDGAHPRRVTAEDQTVASPVFSPDGAHVAFASDCDGVAQVFVVPVDGGVPEQVTFEAEACVPVAFRASGRVVFRSTRTSHLRHYRFLYEVGLDGSLTRELPVGQALTASIAPDDDMVVIGRHQAEYAYWKRYRGGMAGDLWIGSLKGQSFRRLFETEAGAIQPVLLGERVYFLSDREGTGEVWSCALDGGDPRQHTRSSRFYARGLSGHRADLVYTRGGELYRLDTRTDEETRVEVAIRSSGVQLRRRFIPAGECMQELTLSQDGKQLAGSFRGKAFAMDCWGAAALQLGERSGVRYRLAAWVVDDEERKPKEIALISDEGGEEHLELFDAVSRERTYRRRIDVMRRARDVFPNPACRTVAFTDVSGRLVVFDFENEPQTIFESETGPLVSAAWSADGRWLAFVENIRELWSDGGVLHLYDMDTGTLQQVSDPELSVHSPCFDPEGRFLYVLSERTFNPVIDTAQFGASCPNASRIYGYVLQRDELSPFDPRWVEHVEAADKERKKEAGDKDDDDDEVPRPVEIDLDGLDARMIEFPDVEPGSFSGLAAGKRGVLFLAHPTVGLLDSDYFDEDGEDTLPDLVHFDLATRKETTVLEKVEDFEVRGEKTLILMRKSVHVLKTGEEPPDDPPRPGTNRETGLVDLDRIRVEVVPGDEWRQMFVEAWRMQREHFWTPDMAQIDWDEVRDRYLAVALRVATRAELSDVIWEMQGELGTSHAYEFFGDYPDRREYPVGLLGADFTWDGEGYRVDRILDGDAWSVAAASPLASPGVGVEVGDRITAVDGAWLDERRSPNAQLANRARRYVELTVQPGSGGEARRVVVKTLGNEMKLRYRDWVKRNREHVLERSDEKLGYLHIPDMSGDGLAEFYRAFRNESKRDGLIVDVRDNGGGFVSQIVMDALRRKVIQYDRPRYGRFLTYPQDAVRGPMVAICDEFAGSDGDIFCHAFKEYGLGPLVGKRTWGGVIGIDMNGSLADGTVVTQPEYATYSPNGGWDLENRGVDPDVEVELDPASMAAGRDPQLERAIELALERLAAEPVEDPEWAPVPSRAVDASS